MHKRAIRSGYTLLEIMIVLVIMAVVAGSVVHVTYSTNADRLAGARIFKSVLEQVREAAIANNGTIKVDLKDEKLKVEIQTMADGSSTSADLSHILGTAPQELSVFEVVLTQFAPQLDGVKVSGTLESGSKKNNFIFTETGALNPSKDIYVTIESDRYSEPVVLKINAFTGLIEFQ